jgi:hypothetical protein
MSLNTNRRVIARFLIWSAFFLVWALFFFDPFLYFATPPLKHPAPRGVVVVPNKVMTITNQAPVDNRKPVGPVFPAGIDFKLGPVAQRLERRPHKPTGVGSTPTGPIALGIHGITPFPGKAPNNPNEYHIDRLEGDK